ncbi:LysR family transcriptional regulator [Hydromonas duriensis]|nr:LysR family transcriptional regulator [Hydromonas duriensis]
MHIFTEVAKAKSFRRAAEILDMPNSTVSRRISELERDVGLRLFNRTTRRVELTEGGQMYFERCTRIIQEAQLAHTELTEMRTQPSGLIRASLPVDFSVLYLNTILVDFTKQYPKIELDLDLTSKKANMFTDSIDIAIRMNTPKESDLIARNIANFSCALFASPEYLAERGTPTTPEDLLAHDCLRMNDAPWTLTQNDDRRVVDVNGQFIVNNIGMLRQLAIDGAGIFRSTETWAKADVLNGKLVRVLPEWSPPNASVYALTTTRLLPAKVRVFLDFLVQRMTD